MSQTCQATHGPAVFDAFVECVGPALWRARLAAIGRGEVNGPRASRALLQRHAIELIAERGRRGQPPCEGQSQVESLVAEALATLDRLTAAGRDRLVARLRAALRDRGTLVPVFHLLRTAQLQRARGFEVEHAGLDEAADHDLIIHRDGIEAEIACDVISAEAGRGVHRGAWFRLVDLVDPELQRWLADHPGRYLLKLTLPQGLKQDLEAETGGPLAALHRRISDLLSARCRADHDEAAVLRLDPLLLAAAKADELGLASRLRQEFGPEAHLSVTKAGGGMFVMAARAGTENTVGAAIRERLAQLAPTRLSGTRPGILAMFVEDVDRQEWRLLRDRLELEGEARQFLTCADARRVVAVTCTSRLELFGAGEPDAAAEGELRFRNPSHPAAKTAALASAVLSTS